MIQTRSGFLALTCLAVLQSGCILCDLPFFEDFDFCEVEDDPVGFTVTFINNRTSFCEQEFGVDYVVEYTDADGNEMNVASFSSPGGSSSIIVDDAADLDNDGFADAVTVFVNTTCMPDPPIDQWSVLAGVNPPEGSTFKITLDNNDQLTTELIEAAQSSLVIKAVTSVGRTPTIKTSRRRTDAASDQKVAPKKKSCCS